MKKTSGLQENDVPVCNTCSRLWESQEAVLLETHIASHNYTVCLQHSYYLCFYKGYTSSTNLLCSNSFIPGSQSRIAYSILSLECEHFGGWGERDFRPPYETLASPIPRLHSPACKLICLCLFLFITIQES